MLYGSSILALVALPLSFRAPFFGAELLELLGQHSPSDSACLVVQALDVPARPPNCVQPPNSTQCFATYLEEGLIRLAIYGGLVSVVGFRQLSKTIEVKLIVTLEASQTMVKSTLIMTADDKILFLYN